MFCNHPNIFLLNRNKTALLTVQFTFHPPRSVLAPPGQPPDPPFTLVAHRIALETSLLSALQTHVSERNKSKKEKGVPHWVLALALPDEDVPESFIPPLCVMSTPLDPLASLHANPHIPQPGRILREGFYKLDASKALGAVLKHKHFVEFPTIDVWEEDAFHGTIVDDKGTVVRDLVDEHRPKRRKLNSKQTAKAMGGLLAAYGSDDDASDAEHSSAQNGINLLGDYADSDEEGGAAATAFDINAEEWGDDDAEGETDEEYEGSPEELAAMLQKLREAGALRDPGKDGALRGLGALDEEQVDWGESGDEEESGG
uniref:Tubulin alpha chain n=1 Tax=Ganoderma boninense TaxID=34458 RepID=A0A5K1JUT8_9APHY|nr:Tubulin alpha chain [Ganoderma boninense]